MMPQTERRMITPNQIQVIKIWQKQTGLDDGTYRARLRQDYSVSSCTRLTFDQARHMIKTIVGEGYSIPVTKKRPRPARSRKVTVSRKTKNVVRMASKAELEKIQALAELTEWRVENGLARWMHKRFGIERVRTAEGAWLVIEGLKKMFENQMKLEFGPQWWLMRFDDERIMVYIHEHCPIKYQAMIRGQR